MASTPSASALSAVLRCRGNILTRNSTNKRPNTSALSLGLSCGALQQCPDSNSERNHSNQTSTTTRRSFFQGQQIAAGKGLTVSYKSPQLRDKTLRRETTARPIKDSSHPKLPQSGTGAPEETRTRVSGAQNARHQQRVLASTGAGIVKCIQLRRNWECQTFAALIYKTIRLLVHNFEEPPSGFLNVSISLPHSKEKIPMASFIVNRWTTLKNACLSLAVLVSEIMFLKLGVCSSSSPNDDEMNVKNCDLQVSGKRTKPKSH